jgi:rod shape-determining protein MreB and related proteins
MYIVDKLFGLISHDVGIDLGTANTMVLVRGQGIVISEPSVVARHKETGAILAIGTEAKRMVGKTPGNIEAIRPLRDGVIADFDAAEAMLSYYIKQVHQGGSFWQRVPRPRVSVGIPSGVTEVERRAVQEAALSAGAREAFLIEEPMAAAIGAGLKVTEPEGRMMVDIGGGTAEIAVISLGGIVINRSIRIAGDELDEAIIRFARMKYGLVIGETTAEQVKITVGSAYRLEPVKSQDPNTKKQTNSNQTQQTMIQKPMRGNEEVLQTVVRGRDLESGLPKSMKFTSIEIREALMPVVQQIVEGIKDTLEETPPELVADILKNGIVMAGGTSMLRGLDLLIADESKMPVWRMDEPLTGVVRGCGAVLENPDLLKRVRVVGGLR